MPFSIKHYLSFVSSPNLRQIYYLHPQLGYYSLCNYTILLFTPPSIQITKTLHGLLLTPLFYLVLLMHL